MKRNIFSILLLVVLGSIAMLLLSGCDKEETLTPQEFAPPSSFRGLSLDGAVVLYWTRSTSDGVAEFAGYRIKTFNATNVMIDSFMTTRDTARISGLSNGTSYKFKIWSVKSNGDVSFADSIMWGPTLRYLPVRIYEFTSSGNSGIQFFGGNSHSFNYDANAGVIDLWIDGQGTADPLLKSPDSYDSRPNWRTTKFYQTGVTSLERHVDFPPASSFSTTPLTISGGRVYLAITEDGKYVRFQVTSAGIQGTSPDQFVDIVIAYNTGTGEWAKK